MAIFKTRNGESENGEWEWGTGNGEWEWGMGMGNGESLKWGIFKSGNL